MTGTGRDPAADCVAGAAPLEKGKIADLIIVDGNPLENISSLRNTRYVVTNGRMFDCAELWQSVGFKP